MLVPHDGNYGGPHSELHPFWCSPGRQGPRRLQVRIVKIAIFTQITLIDFHAALKMRTIIYFTFPISSWLFTSIPSLTKLRLEYDFSWNYYPYHTNISYIDASKFNPIKNLLFAHITVFPQIRELPPLLIHWKVNF